MVGGGLQGAGESGKREGSGCQLEQKECDDNDNRQPHSRSQARSETATHVVKALRGDEEVRRELVKCAGLWTWRKRDTPTA